MPDIEDKDWQRLDKWLWCARMMRQRSDCAEWVAQGSIRINRQPTVKAHARLRIGDVLTVPIRGDVRVLRVVRLAARRGPAKEAVLLYEDLIESPRLASDGLSCAELSCAGADSSAYPSPCPADAGFDKKVQGLP
jgi:ribosome-associated heat shock protein Hsp15